MKREIEREFNREIEREFKRVTERAFIGGTKGPQKKEESGSSARQRVCHRKRGGKCYVEEHEEWHRERAKECYGVAIEKSAVWKKLHTREEWQRLTEEHQKRESGRNRAPTCKGGEQSKQRRGDHQGSIQGRGTGSERTQARESKGERPRRNKRTPTRENPIKEK